MYVTVKDKINKKEWQLPPYLFLSNMFYTTKNNKAFKVPKSKDDLAWMVSLFLRQIKILTV